MEEGRENISNALKNLSINELSKATDNFFEKLNDRASRFYPSCNLEGLHYFSLVYSNEYRPLLIEWGRRQTADSGYSQEKHFKYIQELQGQMPEDLLKELRELRRLHYPDKKQRERIRYLQKIEEYYNSGYRLPYEWVEYLLNNRDQIKILLVELQKKQGGITPLSETERAVLGFLQSEPNISKLLSD